MRGSLSNVGLGMAVLSGATFGTSGSFAATLIAAGWTPTCGGLTPLLVAEPRQGVVTVQPPIFGTR